MTDGPQIALLDLDQARTQSLREAILAHHRAVNRRRRLVLQYDKATSPAGWDVKRQGHWVGVGEVLV